MTVINIPRAGANEANKAELDQKFGDDRYVIELCAKWRKARALQEAAWAQDELQNLFGCAKNRGPKLSFAALNRMSTYQEFLGTAQPRTVLLTRELLNVALDILWYRARDPESPLGDGPVLEILQNVIDALGWLKSDAPVGKACRDDLGPSQSPGE